MTLENKKKFMVNIAFIAVICVLIYFVFEYLLVWFLPFVIGIICAFILQKPVAWLTKKTHLPRALWSILLVVVLLTGVMGAVFGICILMYEEMSGLITTLTDRLPTFSEAWDMMGNVFNGITDRLPQEISGAVKDAPGSLAQSGIDVLKDTLAGSAKFLVSEFPSVLLASVISIVACCFITIDYNNITDFILRQLSIKNQKLVVTTKSLLVSNVIKVVLGYLLIMVITFAELLVGLLILDVKYAAVISLLIAFVDLLPVLGTGIVLIPWGIIDIIMGNYKIGIGIIILYVVMTIIRNIIEPKIIGKQVGLPSIVTLLAMFIGLEFFGLFGLWGIPVLVIVVSKLQETGLIHIWKSKKDDEVLINENPDGSDGTLPEKQDLPEAESE